MNRKALVWLMAGAIGLGSLLDGGCVTMIASRAVKATYREYEEHKAKQDRQRREQQREQHQGRADQGRQHQGWQGQPQPPGNQEPPPPPAAEQPPG